jgi:hypothetical protein
LPTGEYAGGAILTVTQNGYGKRTAESEYPTKSRGTQAPVGVIPVLLSPIIGRFAHKLDMRRLVTFSFIM